MIRSVQQLLSSFSASPYCLEVPDWFVAQFFEQRRLIAETVKDYFVSTRRATHQSIDLNLLYDGTALFGQSTIEENFALYSIIQLLEPEKILEIGLFRGQTALTLNQALSKLGAGSYIGIDISQETIEIVHNVLKKADLEGSAKLILSNSASAISHIQEVDFSFIDGDHNWPGVVSDVISIYNKLGSGGVIAMHDIGTRAWGWCIQDPGRLLFEILPKLLEGHASIYWLDSMCRQTTMKLLSPTSPHSENSYFTSLGESLETARVTIYDTVKGWGGLGFIYKTDGNHQLDVNQILGLRPNEYVFTPPTCKKSQSKIGRIARKIASKIP